MAATEVKAMVAVATSKSGGSDEDVKAEVLRILREDGCAGAEVSVLMVMRGDPEVIANCRRRLMDSELNPVNCNPITWFLMLLPPMLLVFLFCACISYPVYQAEVVALERLLNNAEAPGTYFAVVRDSNGVVGFATVDFERGVVVAFHLSASVGNERGSRFVVNLTYFRDRRRYDDKLGDGQEVLVLKSMDKLNEQLDPFAALVVGKDLRSGALRQFWPVSAQARESLAEFIAARTGALGTRLQQMSRFEPRSGAGADADDVRIAIPVAAAAADLDAEDDNMVRVLVEEPASGKSKLAHVDTSDSWETFRQTIAGAVDAKAVDGMRLFVLVSQGADMKRVPVSQEEDVRMLQNNDTVIVVVP